MHKVLILIIFSRSQNYKEKDAGKVVLYTTSMGIVRETYAKCANVKQILRTLLIKFEERDVFMSIDYQQEVKDRMQTTDIQIPQLFVDGQHIGVSYHVIHQSYTYLHIIYLCIRILLSLNRSLLGNKVST